MEAPLRNQELMMNINNCSSCGGDHHNIEVFLVGDDGPGTLSAYPWYTNYPNTGERIYIREDGS